MTGILCRLLYPPPLYPPAPLPLVQDAHHADNGADLLWCRLAAAFAPNRTACAVVTRAALTHLDRKTTNRHQGAQAAAAAHNGSKQVLRFAEARWPEAWLGPDMFRWPHGFYLRKPHGAMAYSSVEEAAVNITSGEP